MDYVELSYQITLNTYLIILPIIFIAGFIDSIAGGGGLISLPIYFIAGLPPHNALANNKFSSFFGTFLSTIRFFHHGMIDIKIALISAVFALIGSYLGTSSIIHIEPSFVKYILVILLPIIVIFTLLNKDLGKHNTTHEVEQKKKILLSIITGFAIGFYDGFFGPGTGTFLIFIFVLVMKYDLIVANGNTKVVNLASNMAAVITFIIHGKIIFLIGIPAAIMGILGNYFGSRYVVKNGNKLIRPMFLFVFILLFIKIIWDIIYDHKLLSYFF